MSYAMPEIVEGELVDERAPANPPASSPPASVLRAPVAPAFTTTNYVTVNHHHYYGAGAALDGSGAAGATGEAAELAEPPDYRGQLFELDLVAGPRANAAAHLIAPVGGLVACVAVFCAAATSSALMLGALLIGLIALVVIGCQLVRRGQRRREQP